VDIPLVYFSALVKSNLVDSSGERLGRVDDLIVRLADEAYPPVTGIKARIGRREVFVPADRIASLAPGGVQLVGEKLNLGRFERREGEVLVREDLLKRRMINVVGGKLVRATDLVLGRVEGWWRIVGVDTRFGSHLRRQLPASVRSRAGVQPFLDWGSVEPFVRHVPTARLTMGFGRLRKLHPAQIADLVEAVSHEEGEEIIDAVAADHAFEADVFEELDPEHQVEFLSERTDAQAAQLLGAMEADDAADLIGELDQERREPILHLLPWRTQRTVRALLGYNPATAGGLMSPDFLSLPGTRTVADALEAVRRTDLPEEIVTTVFTVDGDGLLRGVAPVVHLVKYDGSRLLADAAVPPPLLLTPDEELSEIAIRMADYDLTIAPVVDGRGVQLGIVSVDDLLEQMIPDDWRRRLNALVNE
jgi:CBS domain-containing protein